MSAPLDLAAALAAKDALRARIGRPSWLRGIGVGCEGDRFHVRVNVSIYSNVPADAVPGEIDGVKVRLEAVGDIVSRSR